MQALTVAFAYGLQGPIYCLRDGREHVGTREIDGSLVRPRLEPLSSITPSNIYVVYWISYAVSPSNSNKPAILTGGAIMQLKRRGVIFRSKIAPR
jgi:hypothetical protein